jgi:hypothetical protein
MIRCFALLLAIMSLPVAPVSAPARDVKAIYDGRLSLKPGKLSPSEDALMKEKILPAARKLWDEQEFDGACTPGFDASAVDVARGSFTKPGSDQKAILYRYCMTGHNRALNGIAVIEGDRIAAHIIYEGDWSNAVGALPDLNGNGLSEILIAAGGTNQGENWGVISVIEISGSNITTFGTTETYSDNCGTSKGNCGFEAYRISVKAGKTPVFYREAFSGKEVHGGADAWKKSGALKEISLKNDEVEYQLIE